MSVKGCIANGDSVDVSPSAEHRAVLLFREQHGPEVNMNFGNDKIINMYIIESELPYTPSERAKTAQAVMIDEHRRKGALWLCTTLV